MAVANARQCNLIDCLLVVRGAHTKKMIRLRHPWPFNVLLVCLFGIKSTVAAHRLLSGTLFAVSISSILGKAA